MPAQDIQLFFSWFQTHGGKIDTSVIDVIDLPPSQGGRGAVALQDIPEGHTVFSIPRSLILTPRTSTLPEKFGVEAWRAARLHEGWSGLILCTMWEAALGDESKWCTYFDVMPIKFDTPMFWSEEDLAELKGTAVVEKLGKEQAETDYREKLLPAVQSRPDLFPLQDISTCYSLEMYHIMGTRILTRSFTLEGDTKEKDNEAVNLDDPGNTSIGSAMDVDGPPIPDPEQLDPVAEEEEEVDKDNDDDDEEEEKPEVALVPLADFLNARYGEENVKLFYEPDSLHMISTRPIKAGEQIWNTYGDLPNSELLRSFGHVDYLPLNNDNNNSNNKTKFGNPGDVVEIRADLVVRCALYAYPEAGQSHEEGAQRMVERIDWWLEEGGDDVFTFEIDPQKNTVEIPPAVIAFLRLIIFHPEWERAKGKGKPPKPKADVQTVSVLRDIVDMRLEEYATSLEADERVLETSLDALSINKRHALIVRVGEKRILYALKATVNAFIAESAAQEKEERAKANGSASGKRKAVGDGDGRKKKKR